MMNRIYLPDQTIEFEGTLKISFDNSFQSLSINTIAKYPAAVIQINEKTYVCQRLTVVTGTYDTDIFPEDGFDEVVPSKISYKETIKKIKKFKRFYARQFEFGIPTDKLEMIFIADQALAKYTLLKNHNLAFKEVKDD